MSAFMMVDNIPVEIAGEENILAVIRKAGVEPGSYTHLTLPTIRLA